MYSRFIGLARLAPLSWQPRAFHSCSSYPCRFEERWTIVQRNNRKQDERSAGHRTLQEGTDKNRFGRCRFVRCESNSDLASRSKFNSYQTGWGYGPG